MVELVFVLFKFGFLVVLYLFFFWVAWSALKDLWCIDLLEVVSVVLADATGFHVVVDNFAGAVDHDLWLVVERVPGHELGMSYDLLGGAIFGCGNVEIKLEDLFAFFYHVCIVFEGVVVVLEDLGSMNGIYFNGELLTGSQAFHAGDWIRIGDSEFTFSV